MRLKLCTTFLLFSIQTCLAYKILVYSPKWGVSHVSFMGKIADILVKAGHDVVVYQPILKLNMSSTGTQYARVIERPLDFTPKVKLFSQQPNMWPLEKPSFYQELVSTWTVGFMFYEGLAELCSHEIRDTEMLEKLRQENFDLIMGERNCFYMIAELVGIKKYISLYSSFLIDFGNHFMGIPSTPSFVPGLITSDLPFTYFDKWRNFFSHVSSYIRYEYFLYKPFQDAMYEVSGKRFTIQEKAAKSAFFFVNMDEHTDFPRPVSHKIVYIGGFGRALPKPLTPKFQEIMDQSKRGVVLISFGSVAESYRMPLEIKQKFLELFASFPDITFLWKYEKDDDNITAGYTNVILEKWLPQVDLLAHPRLLMFITHGGANSITEATYFGVPLISIPIFGDQYRASHMVTYRKIGIVVRKHEIVEGKIQQSVQKILENPSYRENSNRLGNMNKEKPMSPEERIIKYTEFAIEYGNENNLDMSGGDLGFVEFYCLDIIIPFIMLMVLIIYILFLIVKFIFRLIFVGSKKTKIE